jgi:hypothetical protein
MLIRSSYEVMKWLVGIQAVDACAAMPARTLNGLRLFFISFRPEGFGLADLYHIRQGGHSIKKFDWQCFMDFADYHLKKKKK